MKLTITYNKRGITPIISVILLLMMTIAIAGLAYTWLTRMQASLENSTETQEQTILEAVEVQLGTDAYYLNCSGTSSWMNVTVRNAGTRAATNVRVYVNDQYFGGGNITTLSAGDVQEVQLETGACAAYNGTSSKFKVVSSESEDTSYITTTCSVNDAAC
jgi:flagellin-like protein